jgi:hypothetical protein
MENSPFRKDQDKLRCIYVKSFDSYNFYIFKKWLLAMVNKTS